jgi:hypothetical protein
MAGRQPVNFNMLVMTLASAAAVHLGALPDKASGETHEPNLVGAAQMIDLLALLELKTSGNLSEDEATFLRQVLQGLRLRYVEASSRDTP